MFRALPCYTPKQAAERCKSITLDEISGRATPHNPALVAIISQFKKLIAQTEANGQSAHLIEWDDGTLVLIISMGVKNPSELTCYTLAAAYSHSVKTGEFSYFDFSELPPVVLGGRELSAALDRYIWELRVYWAQVAIT